MASNYQKILSPPIRREIIILFICALLIRTLAALPQQQPNYMDASYSYVNAVNLVEGEGFTEKFIWNYLGDALAPPRPSHLYWMPLTSMIAATGMIFGGMSYRTAQIPFIILSALLIPLTYWISFSLSKQRWQARLASLFMLFSAFYFPFWTAIDNFTPFALAGALALFFAWLGLTADSEVASQAENDKRSSHHYLYPFLSGIFIGLGHLARADGPLLFITICLVLLPLLLTKYSVILRVFTVILLGYGLTIAPWLIRNWLAIGTPLPTGGTKTIWLLTSTDLFSSYNGLFGYNQELTLQNFIDQGWPKIWQGRLWVLSANAQRVLAEWFMIFLTPLTLAGLWRLRQHHLVQLITLYGVLLFIAMTLIFAFPGALGGLFHSGAALLPFIYALAMVGLDTTLNWVGQWRYHWRTTFAKQFLGIGLLFIAMGLSGLVYYNRVLKNDVWNQADQQYPVIANWVTEQNAEALVMINNPPAYQYHGGGLSVVVPYEDVEVTLQVVDKYAVDYLILGPNRPAPLAEIYEQEETHPRLKLVKTFNGFLIFEVSSL